MYLEKALRLVAGAFIMVSLALAYFVSYNWLFLTLFVGVNLFQSGFTNWCLMMNILNAFGIKEMPAKS